MTSAPVNKGVLGQPLFGRRLRALRVERGLSQSALAGPDLSAGYLSRLESGARPPTPRVLELLSERLDVPLSAFEEPIDEEVTAAPPAAGASSLSQLLAAVISSTDRRELGETLSDALEVRDQLDPTLRWQALWLLAQTRSDEGRLEDERRLLEELVTLSEAIGAPVLLARASSHLARCLGLLGDKVGALETVRAARSVADGLSLIDKAEVLQALISAETESGLLSDGRAHSDELLALVGPVGGPVLVKALWTAATVRIRQGDYGHAQEALERAVELETGDDLLLWLRLRLAAASLYLQLDPPLTDAAQARLLEVAPIVDTFGAPVHKQQLMTLRALAAFAAGRVDEARELSAQLDAILRADDEANAPAAGDAFQLSFRDRVRFLALRGQLLIIDGERAAGIQLLQDLARQAQEAQNIELVAEVWRVFAHALAGAPEGTQGGPTGGG
jgi:transcriptional regulator with XRE-family HTH domain